jgi:hypothetical protein
VHAERLVDDLCHAQVDDHARQGQRIVTRDAVQLLQEVEHPVDRDPRRTREILVEAERNPLIAGARSGPVDRLVADSERQLGLGGALDRRAGHLAVALRRVPVPGGEERAVDGDRQSEHRSGHEFLAVDVASPAPRRNRRVDSRLRRRHPEHTEKRPHRHREPI